METLAGDVRFAIRNLLKARGFALIAMFTLALGIGAPTAMFSVVNALLLRPLPFRAPERLMSIGEYDIRGGRTAAPTIPLSYPDFADIAARNRSFEYVAAFRENPDTITGIGEARHAEVEQVSASLFPLLGTQPAMGRWFRPEEDQPGHHVAILSDTFWRAHFNTERSVIGRSIAIGGNQFTVVGVMPPGFQFPIRPEPREVWTTFSRSAEPDDPKDTPMTAQRGNHSLTAIARLKQGVTPAQANGDLASIASALRAAYPDSNTRTGLGARPEIESMLGDSRRPLLILFGAVGLVLLIACANVANLLLGRSSARAREIAIRSALGATRARIIRQLVTESVMLSLGGAALGVAIAAWGLSVVLEMFPPNLPRAQEIGIDVPVLAFTTALAILSGLLFGLAPAWRLSAPNLTATMREGGRGATAGMGHNRLRSALVMAETALGVMLLIGAGLLIRSLERLSHANLGFNPQHVLTASFDLAETRYNPDQQDRFVRELTQRIGTLPGVVQVAGALPLPLNQDGWSVSFNLLEHPLPKAILHSAGIYVVTPGFFETMHIPLLRGRTFGERDERNGKPVMMVTQAFVTKFMPNEDPIGKMVEIGAGEGEARKRYKTREIIGVVGDIRTSNVAKAPEAAYYVPLAQLMWGAPVLTIRTAGDPAAVISGVRKVLAGMDPDAPLFAVRTMEDYLALDLGRARFQTVLLGFFAGIALLLTAIGLYGVVSFAVEQRTHEIGLRMALGAERSDVLRMVLGRGVSLTLVGMAIGVVGAAGLGRLFQALLYETQPHDPSTYLAVCGILAGVALLATYIPAWRATRVDPTVALRWE